MNSSLLSIVMPCKNEEKQLKQTDLSIHLIEGGTLVPVGIMGPGGTVHNLCYIWMPILGQAGILSLIK